MNSLFQLIYISTAVHPFSEKDLETLLEGSRVRNRSMNITGLLVYIKGSFLQVLEGRRSVVLETYERICGDPRHQKLICLLQKQMPERSFPDWSMGFDYVQDPNGHPLPGYQELKMLSVADLESTAHQLVARFLRQMYAANVR